MNNVTKAYDLFVETLPLESIDINLEPAKWHDLYSKECQIYALFNLMTEEEMEQYRTLVANHTSIPTSEEWREQEIQWEYMNGAYPDED